MLNVDWTLPVMMILFMAFSWLMNRIFFVPVARVMKERDAHVAALKGHADAAIAETLSLQSDFDARLREAHHRAQEAIHAAVRAAESRRRAAIEQSRLEVADQIHQSRAAIAKERDDALARIEGEIGGVSEVIQRKVLGAQVAVSATGGEA